MSVCVPRSWCDTRTPGNSTVRHFIRVSTSLQHNRWQLCSHSWTGNSSNFMKAPDSGDRMERWKCSNDSLTLSFYFLPLGLDSEMTTQGWCQDGWRAATLVCKYFSAIKTQTRSQTCGVYLPNFLALNQIKSGSSLVKLSFHILAFFQRWRTTR